MKYSMIATLGQEAIAKTQTSRASIAFQTILAWEETFSDSDFDFEGTVIQIGVLNHETGKLNILEIDGDKRIIDDEDTGRYWDQFVSHWF